MSGIVWYLKNPGMQNLKNSGSQFGPLEIPPGKQAEMTERGRRFILHYAFFSGSWLLIS